MNCPNCEKPLDLCICPEITPKDTRLEVLVLQHPQEPDKDLGTAKLTQLSLSRCNLRVGLSWPNLRAALGREADPKRWAVLYLGSGAKAPSGPVTTGLHFVDRKGLIQTPPPAEALEGLVVLDGTWSQAKALWWRNAWLLKLRRVTLNSSRKSLYGTLRKEPRSECLSTIESVAETLVLLGEPQKIQEHLLSVFSKMLDKAKASNRYSRPKRHRRPSRRR